MRENDFVNLKSYLKYTNNMDHEKSTLRQENFKNLEDLKQKF